MLGLPPLALGLAWVSGGLGDLLFGLLLLVTVMPFDFLASRGLSFFFGYDAGGGLDGWLPKFLVWLLAWGVIYLVANHYMDWLKARSS